MISRLARLLRGAQRKFLRVKRLALGRKGTCPHSAESETPCFVGRAIAALAADPECSG
jgi:hypothetical protein